jgi:hypothetical protein
MDWTSLLTGLVAGFAGGFTVKSVIVSRKSTIADSSRTDNRQGKVVQTRNTVSGSMAGRDISDSNNKK